MSVVLSICKHNILKQYNLWLLLKRGGPPKKWIDDIKEDVELMELSIEEAVNLTRDREKCLT